MKRSGKPSLSKSPTATPRPYISISRPARFVTSVKDQRRGAMDAERFHKIGAMHGDGVHAQFEQRGNLLVRLALGDQLQNLLFAVRELAVIGIRLSRGGQQTRRDDSLARGNLLNS